MSAYEKCSMVKKSEEFLRKCAALSAQVKRLEKFDKQKMGDNVELSVKARKSCENLTSNGGIENSCAVQHEAAVVSSTTKQWIASREERASLIVWKRPIITLQYFFKELCIDLYEFGTKILMYYHLVALFVIIMGFGAVFYRLEGPHQKYVEVIEKQFIWCAYWLGLGVLSSVGLGTGLHTFVLYLGPHIAAVTLAAYECNSVNFPQPPYPDEIICPEGEDSSVITILKIMSKVRLEAFMWLCSNVELTLILMSTAEHFMHVANGGIKVDGLKHCLGGWHPLWYGDHSDGIVPVNPGVQQFTCNVGFTFIWIQWEPSAMEIRGAGTALGELPPYFMAKAARLSGQDHDDEELKEFEELQQKKNNPKEQSFVDKTKLAVEKLVERVGFFGILGCASIPNPLFDLAGITCGHFLVPFWTFFGATLIGKAVIKMHIQKLFVIIAFNESQVQKLVGHTKYIPYVGKYLHAPLQEFLAKQKAKFHRKVGTSVHADGTWIASLFEKFVLLMVFYFVLSIINSMAQSHHKRLQKRHRAANKVATD